jgi:16S rRNA processing protein RimM
MGLFQQPARGVARPGYLVLGRVVRAHGVRGEAKLAVSAPSWQPFASLPRLWLGPPGGPYRAFEVEGARVGQAAVLLKLAGVDSAEAAAALAGWEVAIPREEAPAPPEGTFYHYDILGLEVVRGGEALGRVEEILETPAHDVYVVRGPAGEWMLPASRAHIRRIDPAAGRIEMQPEADVRGLMGRGEESPEGV